MIATTAFDRAKMSSAAPLGFSLATEIADFLVKQGVPFSHAHEAAGGCVKRCEELGIELKDLSDADLLSIHPKLSSEVRNSLDALGAITARNSINGTAPSSVKHQISGLRKQIDADAHWINNERNRFSGMMGQ